MSSAAQGWTFLIRHQEVAAFVPAIVRAADSEKEALGFFPAPVFDEFARKEQLLVAINRAGNESVFGGYVIFTVKAPTAHVRQIYVHPRFRRGGLGSQLLDELKKHLTEFQFIAIQARVREDLTEANAFWEGQGFYTQRLALGGLSRNRMIVVRSHELETPQLFSSSGINQLNPFGLNFQTANDAPLYLLDLNVLFDLGRRRARHDDVVAVFRAERMQACQLAISSEIDRELGRTSTAGVTDPMVDLTSVLPKFETPNDGTLKPLVQTLAQLVFPDKASALSVNDLSDLRHLATAIHHHLHGFITSDSKVLAAAISLREVFGIEVLSPAAFMLDEEAKIDAGTHSTTSHSVLAIEELQASAEGEISALLTRLDVSRGAQASEWAVIDGSRRICRRIVVRADSQVIGYLVWPTLGQSGLIDAKIAIDERHHAAPDAARVMLEQLTGLISVGEVARIRLRFPTRQVVVREVADTLGFVKSSNRSDELQKISLNGIVTEENWSTYRSALISACNVKLPTHAPKLRSLEQQVEIYSADGNRVHLPFLTLESYLSPALFCLPGRIATLTPLRREYAEHLLQHLPQTSLLPHARARLFTQRHFINDAKALSSFSRGGLIAFYESGKGKGLGAVIALARVLRSYHREESALSGIDLNPSVLGTENLASIGKSRIRTVTVFDNIQVLPRPVSLSVLQRLGCGTPNQLITSRRLTDDQILGIVREGLL